MIPYCKEENIALTPYSALASGRLAKHPYETSKRMEEDTYAKGKYDATAEQKRMQKSDQMIDCALRGL